MKTHSNFYFVFILLFLMISCSGKQSTKQEEETEVISEPEDLVRPEIYATVALETDISKLSENEKKLIPILIEAAKVMDDLFWQQAYGNKTALLNYITDARTKKFVEINYGPWDRLKDNRPFIDGVGEKPKGANLYPGDMNEEEFQKFENESKTSLYTIIGRAEDGSLKSIPYNENYAEELGKAAELLNEAAEITENAEFKKYLNLRAKALLSNEYDESDIAWMEMKSNGIDVIIGPIENYEDQLFGYKAAFEAYVLVKDKEWSARLEKYASLLPELQKGLPVDDIYKQETPGSNAQLNAYDVVYYAGDCNAGSKTIAVNLPNDEEIQLKMGTRRSQLKNAMKAKFDKIMVPISKMLIDDSQRKHITFDAFFGNTMFHEVAHGLGIKHTINDKGTVREALKEQASALEEGKADILGLYMVTQLFEKGEIEDGEIMDNYVTFLAGILRSVRFGASSAHGKANMLRFNYFLEKGAFSKNDQTGMYMVDFEKMQLAMNELSALILKLQGDGDYEGVQNLMKEKGLIFSDLQADLDKLGEAGIPVDIVFEQGVEVLGL